MTWSVKEIEEDWLAASITSLAVSSEDSVAAFDRVEKILGREWIESGRASGGNIIRGSGPTLRVVNMGQRLAALDGVAATEKLISQIRRGDDSADAELTAIFLVRSQHKNAHVELYPPVGSRVADFRVRNGEDPRSSMVRACSVASDQSG
jgi:hypothetical protein